MKMVGNSAEFLARSRCSIVEYVLKILQRTDIRGLFSGSLPRGRMEEHGMVRMGVVKAKYSKYCPQSFR